MSDLEAVLGGLAIFEQLRPDEVARIAPRFTRVRLVAGEQRPAGSAAEWRCDSSDAGQPHLLVVIDGEVEVVTQHGAGELRARMTAGDRYGTFSMVTGYAKPFTVSPRRRATIAILDRAGYEAVMAEFPVVALPLADRGELAVRHLARQV